MTAWAGVLAYATRREQFMAWIFSYSAKVILWIPGSILPPHPQRRRYHSHNDQADCGDRGANREIPRLTVKIIVCGEDTYFPIRSGEFNSLALVIIEFR